MGKKITQLATITEVADDDLIVGVDVSDTSGSDNGTNKKFTKATLLDGLAPLNPQLTGWNPDAETWVYHNVDDPTGYIKIEDKDVSANYSVGWRIMFTNGGNVIKGIITAITYSAPHTIITFLHEIDPTDSKALYLLQNSAITENYFSIHRFPLGFSADPRSWTYYVECDDSTTVGYYSLATVVVPYGKWIPNISADMEAQGNNTYRTGDFVAQCQLGLSTVNNSLSGTYPQTIMKTYWNINTTNMRLQNNRSVHTLPIKIFDSNGATTLYLVARVTGNSIDVANVIDAQCEFLSAYF